MNFKIHLTIENQFASADNPSPLRLLTQVKCSFLSLVRFEREKILSNQVRSLEYSGISEFRS